MAQDWIDIRVTAKQLGGFDFERAVKHELFGRRLADNVRKRLRKGLATEGIIPKAKVNMLSARPRWTAKDKPATYQFIKKPDRRLPPPKPGFPSRLRSDVPASVFQQLRTLGGHAEPARRGETWAGWDHEIRFGWDAGEDAGKVWGYVWLDAERFISANYGPTPGIRTGTMERDIVSEVKRLSGGRTQVRIKVKGKDPRGRQVWSLLKELKERQATSNRKLPSSYKAALLQARDRRGMSGKGSGPGVGWIDPTEAELDQAILEYVTNGIAEEIKRLPVRVVVKV